MLYYDKIILAELIYKIKLKDKVILDYGCGTGRNWPDLLRHNPAKIIGCDISPEMLAKLNSKFKNAETYLIKDEKQTFLKDRQVDLIISTLVVAHIKNIDEIFSAWDRAMKNSGDIIITDFHPELLAKGGARTFKQGSKSFKIENYIHMPAKIEEMLFKFGFRKINFIQKIIDDEVKHFYEKQNAVSVYDKFKGTPFIYGIHLAR